MIRPLGLEVYSPLLCWAISRKIAKGMKWGQVSATYGFASRTIDHMLWRAKR